MTAVRVKRVTFWVAFGIFVIVTGLIAAAIKPNLDSINNPPLSADNRSPNGAAAVAEVLRDHGIAVTVTQSRASAERDAVGGTLVVPATPQLSDEAFTALISSADVVVLISPTASQLSAALGADRAGFAGETVDAKCEVPLTDGVGDVTIGARFTAGGATGCYPSGDAYGLLVGETDGRLIYAIDGTTVLSNETVLNEHNAALALRLLAQRDHVQWYVATAADTDGSGAVDTSLGSFTPSWVTPVMVLLFAVAAAAIWWRGRRFGALVTERLPVTVRASETLEGRARLYAQGRDATHTAHILRRSALTQLGTLLGVDGVATPDTVASRASAVLSAPQPEILAVLAGSVPANDAELMLLSDQLTNLLDGVAARVRPEGSHRDRN